MNKHTAASDAPPADREHTLIRKNISLPVWLWSAVSDQRFERRIRSESEAMRQIVQAGVEAMGKREVAR